MSAFKNFCPRSQGKVLAIIRKAKCSFSEQPHNLRSNVLCNNSVHSQCDFLTDAFPDNPWIDNTEFPVQNLDIPESNLTAQEVLEETILSPTGNLPSREAELVNFFPEEFINLSTIESNMNSLNTLHTTAGFPTTNNDIMANIFGDFVVDAKQKEAASQIQYGTFLRKPKPVPQNDLIPEPIPDFDSTAVVPNVFPASPESVPDSPVETTDSGIFASDFDFDISNLDPSIITLLDNLEKSAEASVEPCNRKRALVVEDESAEQLETPVCKKRRQPGIPVEDKEVAVDKVDARRIKNNAASRVCRASRKARHADLFCQEKELGEENEKLAKTVKELSETVEFLRSYLVNRLSGQAN